ncbi:hypothetical protein B0T21DRAFT_256978, partial [Apiosordaria backusii]
KPAQVYLRSVAIGGAPSMFQRFCKACSFQYTTSNTCRQGNTVSFGILCSMVQKPEDQRKLRRRLSLGPVDVTVEWSLGNDLTNQCPTFKTSHRITNVPAISGRDSYKLGFTRNLNWAQAIATRYTNIAQAQRRRALPPRMPLGVEKLSQSRPSNLYRRRRRDSVRIVQQTRRSNIAELRRRAEQHQQQTGDMS